MPTLDDRLLPVFARQHWLVSMADIEAADGTAAQAARRVQAGRWGLADVNVYRLLGVPSSWHSRQLAPILSIPGGVASHFAAGALHGIDGIGRGTPELSIPRGQEHRQVAPSILRHPRGHRPCEGTLCGNADVSRE